MLEANKIGELVDSMLQSPHHGGFSVFAGVAERTREGNDLYREMIESSVIKLGEKQVFNCASDVKTDLM
ncbi:predicted protein [Arabidopsis lyrata subsp. lyrata]|uniref:H(+)-transporting two-sector ATPase n=1 Tax=Arabidopsis lyrata subsp. lyrata TaxID=81972 RepID=D7LR62_ARALL|nr:predicted protein [Arabidopsis lyrata subsp. lyrata]